MDVSCLRCAALSRVDDFGCLLDSELLSEVSSRPDISLSESICFADSGSLSEFFSFRMSEMLTTGLSFFRAPSVVSSNCVCGINVFCARRAALRACGDSSSVACDLS